MVRQILDIRSGYRSSVETAKKLFEYICSQSCNFFILDTAAILRCRSRARGLKLAKALQ